MRRSLKVFPLSRRSPCLWMLTSQRATPPPSGQGPDSASRKKAFDEAVDSLHTSDPRPQVRHRRCDAGRGDLERFLSRVARRPEEKCSQVLIPSYRIVLRVRDAPPTNTTATGAASESASAARLCSPLPPRKRPRATTWDAISFSRRPGLTLTPRAWISRSNRGEGDARGGASAERGGRTHGEAASGRAVSRCVERRHLAERSRHVG